MKIIFFSLSLLFFFPCFILAEDFPLLGLVVEIQGKACVKKKDAPQECVPLQEGEAIYSGDTIFIQNGEFIPGNMVLLDWKSKERFDIPEGSYNLKIPPPENKSLLSEVLEKIASITSSNKEETSAGATRTRIFEECQPPKGFPPFSPSPSQAKDKIDIIKIDIIETTWLRQCLKKKSQKNTMPPPSLYTGSIPLPPFSSYFGLPENLHWEGEKNKGWILSRKNHCGPLKSNLAEQILFPGLNYLIWPYENEFYFYGFSPAFQACRQKIENNIQKLKKIYPNENNLFYLWMLYDLYKENTLHYQELLILLKLKKIAQEKP